jgi:predicted phosphatase
MNKLKVPQTDSIEELAQFWDTHDLTDFEHELAEVSEPIFQRKKGATLTISLHPKELAAVRRIAKARGIEQTALVKQWVLEKIHAA